MIKVYILTITLILASTSAVFAATPSPTQSPAETPISSTSSELTEAAVEKIKDVVKNNPTTTPPNSKPEIIGLVGHIKTINTDTFTLVDKRGPLVQIKTDEKTALLSGTKTIKFKDLAVNDRTIVIGTSLDADDIISAVRIIVVPEPKITATRSTIAGNITRIDTKNKIINFKTLDQKDLRITINNKSTPAISNFSDNQKILAIISTDVETDNHTLLKAKILE